MQLAINSTTVAYTCPSSGTKFRRTFSGFLSYGAMETAVQTWLINQAYQCSWGAQQIENWR